MTRGKRVSMDLCVNAHIYTEPHHHTCTGCSLVFAVVQRTFVRTRGGAHRQLRRLYDDDGGVEFKVYLMRSCGCFTLDSDKANTAASRMCAVTPIYVPNAFFLLNAQCGCTIYTLRLEYHTQRRRISNRGMGDFLNNNYSFRLYAVRASIRERARCDWAAGRLVTDDNGNNLTNNAKPREYCWHRAWWSALNRKVLPSDILHAAYLHFIHIWCLYILHAVYPPSKLTSLYTITYHSGHWAAARSYYAHFNRNWITPITSGP